MADTPEAKRARIPLDMRPRSTPNAEINAQKRDEWRYEEGVYDRPTIKPLPMRGYKSGGKVNPFASGGPETRRSPSLDHRHLFKR